MPTLTVGALTFEFPTNWQVSQFDDWAVYRNQFIQCSEARTPCTKCGHKNVSGAKSIDILAIDGSTCCWIIEVKDYRQSKRTKVIDLPDEMALKVRDSLAALVAARGNANDADEQALAKAALQCSNLRVVLHLEQPSKPSTLFPRGIDPANVKQRLRQLIKAIDPHPLVIEKRRMENVAWSAKQSIRLISDSNRNL